MINSIIWTRWRPEENQEPKNELIAQYLEVWELMLSQPEANDKVISSVEETIRLALSLRYGYRIDFIRSIKKTQIWEPDKSAMEVELKKRLDEMMLTIEGKRPA
jgi:hypothetical protein